MKKIGLTTTVPIEVLLAAGYAPIDLNNLFVTSENYDRYIDIAERDGFPKSMCAWIKGIYGACIENDIEEIVGVVEGDCSNTSALVDVLKMKGIKVYPFGFPHSHDFDELKAELNKFMDLFGVTYQAVEDKRLALEGIRKKAKYLDELTYIDRKASGFENHLYQLCLSDLGGDFDKYEKELDKVIADVEVRTPEPKRLKLGYIGVPPMTGDLYGFVEEFEAEFIFNEVQREFAFPRYDEAENIYQLYHNYTYPYGIDFRIEKLKEEIDKRQLDGIIHYTQAFCYRAVDDIILKHHLDIPMLNIEGDKHNKLDARTKLRLEAFLDMLVDLKEVE